LRRTDLERVARRVVRALGKDDCVLVGGLAVGAYGYVRATKDVDFVARIPLAEARRRLRERGMPAVVRRGDPAEGDFPCVRATVDGVRVDVLPELVPIEWDQAVELRLSRGTALRVVDLDALFRLKLQARGPKDLMDVAALLLRHPGQGPRVRELATAYGVREGLDAWLEDRRLRAEMAEARQPRRGMTRGPRRRSARPSLRRGSKRS
jgi:hypothetical protein